MQDFLRVDAREYIGDFFYFFYFFYWLFGLLMRLSLFGKCKSFLSLLLSLDLSLSLPDYCFSTTVHSHLDHVEMFKKKKNSEIPQNRMGITVALII